MNVARYREQAQKGLAILEKAVMGVMFESNGPMKSSEISKSLDIPPYARSGAYEIVLNVLFNLECRGLVSQRPRGLRGSWALTDEGIRLFREN